jgi:diaminohydroxyphosphoribosylaminopyrimidine deaminase / 5-amino-6-(5-phosphoribosylamino)uracil reductase
MENDLVYMKQALSLAEKGAGYTSPNPQVGAVVVKNHQVVGEGYHQVVGGPHAEVNAIDDAGDDAKDATLYVTLEPCNHTGRTPPCTEKILQAGIKRVVVAMVDPNPNVAGGGNAYLSSKGIEVDCGILADQAEKQNESFIKYSRTKMPFVTLKCAATLDGRLATRTGDSKWVTGPVAREFVHRLRHVNDAIMVGVETIKLDDPSLTTRIEDLDGQDPVRIILDSRLTIPEDAKVLRLNSDSDTIIATGLKVPTKKREALIQRGIKVLAFPLKDGKVDLALLMAQLGDMNITSVLVEGGGGVLASALADGIADKIYFFYAPKILGGDDGVPICRGQGPAYMKEAVPVTDMQVHRFGDDIMVEGYLKGI